MDSYLLLSSIQENKDALACVDFASYALKQICACFAPQRLKDIKSYSNSTQIRTSIAVQLEVIAMMQDTLSQLYIDKFILCRPEGK